jgi:hypothetical protein
MCTWTLSWLGPYLGPYLGLGPILAWTLSTTGRCPLVPMLAGQACHRMEGIVQQLVRIYCGAGELMAPRALSSTVAQQRLQVQSPVQQCSTIRELMTPSAAAQQYSTRVSSSQTVHVPDLP